MTTKDVRNEIKSLLLGEESEEPEEPETQEEEDCYHVYDQYGCCIKCGYERQYYDEGGCL